MSFDLEAMRAQVARHGPVVRVVVAEVRGSAPREAGTSMLVWPDRIHGTIGGGTLEHAAIAAARAGHRGPSRHALGPDLGQCCGGAVTLHTAAWDEAALARVAPGAPVVSGAGERPGALEDPGAAPRLRGDWLIERQTAPGHAVWIWGAGHVGRALAGILAPLPAMRITWIDDAADRFPAEETPGIARLVAARMPDAVAHVPDGADHLIATYAHDIDLGLCHALLGARAGSIGLIGSATKWARFRSRLRQLGHADADIARIACPIGDPSLGRHPQAIAVGVAAGLLREATKRKERAG